MNPYHPNYHLSLPYASNYPQEPGSQVPTSSGSFTGEMTTPTNIDLFYPNPSNHSQIEAPRPQRPLSGRRAMAADTLRARTVASGAVNNPLSPLCLFKRTSALPLPHSSQPAFAGAGYRAPIRPATQPGLPSDYYDHTWLVHPAIQQGFPDIYPLTTFPPVLPTFGAAPLHQGHPPASLSHTVTGASQPVQSYPYVQHMHRASPQYDHLNHPHPALQHGVHALYPATAFPPVASTPRVVPSSSQFFPPLSLGHTVTGNTRFFPSHEYGLPIPHAAPPPPLQGATTSTDPTEQGPPPRRARKTRKRRATSEADETPSKKTKRGASKGASASTSSKKKKAYVGFKDATGDFDDDDKYEDDKLMNTPIWCRWLLRSNQRCGALHTTATILDHTLEHAPKAGEILCKWEGCDSRCYGDPAHRHWMARRPTREPLSDLTSLRRHLKQAHFNLALRQCHFCGKTQRYDAYARDHGAAKYCDKNPNRVPRPGKAAPRVSSQVESSLSPASSSSTSSTPEFVEGSSGGSSAPSPTEEVIDHYPSMGYAASELPVASSSDSFGASGDTGSTYLFDYSLPYAPQPSGPASLSTTPTVAPSPPPSVPNTHPVASLPALSAELFAAGPDDVQSASPGSDGATCTPDSESVPTPPAASSWPHDPLAAPSLSLSSVSYDPSRGDSTSDALDALDDLLASEAAIRQCAGPGSGPEFLDPSTFSVEEYFNY
ncbi:uncharacterized protein BXZ73DRAFT_106185 [Epithele typhae]|uniref:uncharacterized protein n=1 Tax=Epithele typhae TaxID=378194 RepID=UPI002007C932|nr:uncharacterized protein BXZ73DRAFT_106185 [Epithele typhae]KAH9915456.1 hypothetical protein BXZ73DRAFT_106185 [Epithele typhae]